ncbi:MAG: protein kinase [Myxococcaceae bacterium]
MSYSSESGSAATVRSPSGNPIASTVELNVPKKLERGERLGKGGMGEVWACTDHQLTRTIALKVATTRQAEDLDRFLREARIQGQLQHPSIVPVHELGSTEDGAPYFTMKKVQGVTLQQVIERLSTGDTEVIARFTRRKLLQAYVSICQAIDYAHQHGVLHRDLKPANVMLGDFGEVYVLDWGLAKRVGVEELGGPETPAPLTLDIQPGESNPTVAGSLLGTPGYLAPEQVVGGSATHKSDLYALGVVLFELLTWQRAVEAPNAREALLKTRDGIDVRARVRAPERDVPPELEAICLKACALEPEQRHGSVRQLISEIERYLEGERDLELRKQLSQEHSQKAVAAAALTTGDAVEARRQSMQELGRALALDPNNRQAIEVLMRMLREPPKEIPPEVTTDLKAIEDARSRVAARAEALGYLMLALMVPVIIMMGIRVPWVMATYLLSVTVAGAFSFAQGQMKTPSARLAIIGTALAGPSLAISGFMLSPFIMLPSMVVLHMFTAVLFLPKPAQKPGVAIGAISALVPLLSWGLGLTPEPLKFTAEGIVLLPVMLSLPKAATLWMLVSSTLGFGLFAVIAATRARRQIERAEQQVALQSWTVSQLLPKEASQLGRGVLIEQAETLACPVGG